MLQRFGGQVSCLRPCRTEMPPKFPDRKQQPLRLTAAQAARVEKAAKKSGRTIQDFMLTAVMGKVEEWETAREARRAERRERETARSSEPQGLGIRPRSAPLESEDATPATVTSPVVVNIGSGKEGGMVSFLAAYVQKGGPSYERDTRRRQAVAMIQANTESEEAQADLTRQLEAALSKPAERSRLSLDQIGQDLLGWIR